MEDERKSEGRRLQRQSPRGGAVALIVAGAVLAVLLAGYLILCAVTAGRDTFFPRTSVSGIDVSGLTKSQAVQTVQRELEQRIRNASIDARAGSETIRLEVAQLVDCEASADGVEAIRQKSGSFFADGARFLKSLVADSDYTVDIQLKDAEQLRQQLAEAVQGMETAVSETTYERVGDELVFTMGKSGLAVDLDDLTGQLAQAIAAEDYTPITCVMENVHPQSVDLDAVYDEIHTEAQNASLNKETMQITPSVDGVSFDKSVVQAALSGAAEGQTIQIPLRVTEAEVSTDALEAGLFRDELGAYSTLVSGSSNRKSNVSLAASKCNVILLPGEEFSYNGLVGSRTKSAGFLEAPAYVNGETVASVGGGVCQVSSTIYMAALLANLKIVERQNHSYQPTYIPSGLDATVYYGALDFRFENDQPYPIQVKSYYKDGRVYVKIYGTNTTNTTVKMTTEVVSTTPFEVIEKEDPTLPVGTTKVDVTGYTGAVVKAYRNVYQNGVLVSSTLESTNRYKVRNKVVLVGTKDAVSTGTTEPVTPVTPTPPTTPVTPVTPTEPVQSTTPDTGTSGETTQPSGGEEQTPAGTEDAATQPAGEPEQPGQELPAAQPSEAA